VTATLGTPSGSEASPLPRDITDGQATLASVIARAQLRSLPMRPLDSDVPVFTANHDIVSDQDPAPSNNELPTQEASQPSAAVSATPSLTLYGLSNDQARMLEQAIANAASAAQAQAEAEAALEEDEGAYEDDEPDEDVEVADPDA